MNACNDNEYFKTQQGVNMASSQHVNTQSADRPLKGLLMGKGAAGLSDKIRTVLRKMQLVQQAMKDLETQQRLSRETAGSECIELYLATNLRTQLLNDDIDTVKHLSAAELSFEHTKRPMALEWRARREFALAYGYGNTARIHAFNPQHDHYCTVREYVSKQSPEYYEVLAGYDVVRVTLNNSVKSLRKTILDLNSVSEESRYPDDVAKEAEKLSRRLFKTLPGFQELTDVLNQLYA
ncbi:hypothetical protein D0C16_08385 [Cellvibrio sp. KY-GH-1]|nr:hypothetical protein D0C16_08385 [Cellvibrio sp. KY-GH-1]